jgi:glycerol uptake facilitator-like aquaporin
MKFSLTQRLCAEFLGTGCLLMAAVGSGIMGERLSGGDVAIALLANSIATGAVLVTFSLTFGSISGAHFNPVVSVADAFSGGIAPAEILPYCLAQEALPAQSVRIARLACRRLRCRGMHKAVQYNFMPRRSLGLD